MSARDDRPIYLFPTRTLVFAPFEALASLATALLALPSRVARVRFVLEGDAVARRGDLVAAVLASARGRRARAQLVDEVSFSPVALPGDREGLVEAVVRTFAWLGLSCDDAPRERDCLRAACHADDDERALRGELSVLATRSEHDSHVVFFDDGTRELLAISVPRDAAAEDASPLDRDSEERIEAILSSSRP